MLKQLSKIGMLCCLLAVGTSAFAQKEAKNESTLEYPRYGFWSNWSIGGEVLGTWQASHMMGDNKDMSRASNVGSNLFFEHELNHVWAIRFNLTTPTYLEKDAPTADQSVFYRYSKATIDMKFSWNNAIAGYNPNTRWSIYSMLGPGAVATYDGNPKWGVWAIAVEIGLGYSYKIGDHSTIFAEYIADLTADYPNIFRGNWNNLNAMLGLGYMYNFGVTSVDAALAAQRALLTQENFDALNTQVEGLEEQLAVSKANEQRLENRVSELENEIASVQQSNLADADSLRRVLDQIKSEQSKFYALPFSILFGIDQSYVSSSERIKLKAIAKVMQDNPDAKFTIVGYCDYTGSDAYNMKLSQKRAENVKKQLVEKYGIAEDRLSCDWKGKGEAYGDIKYSINRRVAFYRVIEY